MMIWRFRRLIEAHGGDPEHWPAERRAAAEALLRQSRRARDLLDEARQLDAALDADVRPGGDERLAALIVARATALPQERLGAAPIAIGWSLPRLWPQAAGLAAAGVLGFVVGWTDLLPSPAAADGFDLADFIDAGADDEEPLL